MGVRSHWARPRRGKGVTKMPWVPCPNFRGSFEGAQEGPKVNWKKMESPQKICLGQKAGSRNSWARTEPAKAASQLERRVTPRLQSSWPYLVLGRDGRTVVPDRPLIKWQLNDRKRYQAPLCCVSVSLLSSVVVVVVVVRGIFRPINS